MAFCGSYTRLYFSSFGFDSFSNRNLLLVSGRFGMQRRFSSHCILVSEEAIFSATCWRGTVDRFRRKQGGRLTVRSELQTSASIDTSHLVACTVESEGGASLKQETRESYSNLDHEDGGGHSSGDESTPPGGGRSGGSGGGGDGGGYDHESGDDQEDEFGPVLKFEDVIKEADSRQAILPSDMLEAAKTVGIQKDLLFRYLDLQASAWPLGIAVRSCSLLRNRILADPSFLFKVGTEIIIDSFCATFAEVQKRGNDFWAEFELYAADLLVGLVVNVALVGMLAPHARFGQPSASKGLFGRLARAYGALPSSVFEAERPRCKYSFQQRIATYIYKGLLYGSVGFACGIVGQGIANMIMTAKRSLKKSEDDIPIPPLLKSAVLWGVFLAVSSNTRYQIINGLEQLVEGSPVARRTPLAALAFTVGIRFANNVYGAMQFVDWARWTGVQ